MRLIYGSPTTGKSTFQKEMAQMGKSVVDTDSLIEAMILGTRGMPSTEWKAAWDWWKTTSQEEKKPITDSVRALIERWRATLGDEMVVTTNLHWPGMKPDLAFGREPADIVTLKRKQYESGGRELTDKDAARMLKWAVPTDLGVEVKILPVDEFISDHVPLKTSAKIEDAVQALTR